MSAVTTYMHHGRIKLRTLTLTAFVQNQLMYQAYTHMFVHTSTYIKLYIMTSIFALKPQNINKPKDSVTIWFKIQQTPLIYKKYFKNIICKDHKAILISSIFF